MQLNLPRSLAPHSPLSFKVLTPASAGLLRPFGTEAEITVGNVEFTALSYGVEYRKTIYI